MDLERKSKFRGPVAQNRLSSIARSMKERDNVSHDLATDAFLWAIKDDSIGDSIYDLMLDWDCEYSRLDRDEIIVKLEQAIKDAS